MRLLRSGCVRNSVLLALRAVMSARKRRSELETLACRLYILRRLEKELLGLLVKVCITVLGRRFVWEHRIVTCNWWRRIGLPCCIFRCLAARLGPIHLWFWISRTGLVDLPFVARCIETEGIMHTSCWPFRLRNLDEILRIIQETIRRLVFGCGTLCCKAGHVHGTSSSVVSNIIVSHSRILWKILSYIVLRVQKLPLVVITTN